MSIPKAKGEKTANKMTSDICSRKGYETILISLPRLQRFRKILPFLALSTEPLPLTSVRTLDYDVQFGFAESSLKYFLWLDDCMQVVR